MKSACLNECSFTNVESRLKRANLTAIIPFRLVLTVNKKRNSGSLKLLGSVGIEKSISPKFAEFHLANKDAGLGGLKLSSR